MNAIEKLTIKLGELALEKKPFRMKDYDEIAGLIKAARQSPQDAAAVDGDVPSDDLVQWLADILCTEYSTGNWRTTARVAIRSIQQRLPPQRAASADAEAKSRDELFWRDSSAWWKAEAEKRDVRIAELGAALAKMATRNERQENTIRGNDAGVAAWRKECEQLRARIAELERAGAGGGEPRPTVQRLVEIGRAAWATECRGIDAGIEAMARAVLAADAAPVSGGVREWAREIAGRLPHAETYRQATSDACSLIRELAQ